jgi:hypothetical protein
VVLVYLVVCRVEPSRAGLRAVRSAVHQHCAPFDAVDALSPAPRLLRSCSKRQQRASRSSSSLSPSPSPSLAAALHSDARCSRCLTLPDLTTAAAVSSFLAGESQDSPSCEVEVWRRVTSERARAATQVTSGLLCSCLRSTLRRLRRCLAARRGGFIYCATTKFQFAPPLMPPRVVLCVGVFV